MTRSKTDQEHAGVVIAIPEGRRLQPKRLLLAWVALAGNDTGPVFRKLTPGGRLTTKPMSDRGSHASSRLEPPPPGSIRQNLAVILYGRDF